MKLQSIHNNEMTTTQRYRPTIFALPPPHSTSSSIRSSEKQRVAAPTGLFTKGENWSRQKVIFVMLLPKKIHTRKDT
jgi:hypothetical protein